MERLLRVRCGMLPARLSGGHHRLSQLVFVSHCLVLPPCASARPSIESLASQFSKLSPCFEAGPLAGGIGPNGKTEPKHHCNTSDALVNRRRCRCRRASWLFSPQLLDTTATDLLPDLAPQASPRKASLF